MSPHETFVESTWSNWWGSPELLACTGNTLIERATRPGEPLAEIEIEIAASGHRERYDSVSAFGRASPEVLRRFRYARLRTVKGYLALSLELQRPASVWSRQRTSLVKLTVAGGPQVPSAVVVSAARSSVAEINWGYRAYWGSSQWHSELGARTMYHRFGFLIRIAAIGALGFVGGFLLVNAADRLWGTAPPLVILAAGALGFLTPFAIDRAIPDVEIAAGGRTRLLTLARWLSATAVASFGVQFVSFVVQ